MNQESMPLSTASNKWRKPSPKGKLSFCSLLVILLIAGCSSSRRGEVSQRSPTDESIKAKKDTGPAIQNESQIGRTKSSAEYTVTISEEDWRKADVICQIVTGDALSLSMNNNGAPRVPNGHASFVRNLSAVDSSGNAVPVKDLGQARWEIAPAVNESITLYYEVLLEHDKSDLSWGPAEAPYVTEDGSFWTGRALFIVADTNDITVRFNLPKGWNVSTPWQSVPGQPFTFFLKNEDELTESFVFAGTHIEEHVKVDDTDILLALDNKFKQSKELLQDTLQKLLNACVELFGGTVAGRTLIVVNHREGSGLFYGGVFGRSISLLMGDEPNEENKGRWAPLILHEELRLWNGYAIKHAGSEKWFSEGFTDYYSMIMSTRIGLINEEEFIQRLEHLCERYFTKSGPMSIRETPDYELQYTGGSLVGLCMDIRIRQATNNAKSLDDLMRQMYQDFGRTGREYSMDEVISIANSIAQIDHADFFKSYVTGTDGLPLEQLLGDIGLDIKKEVSEELPALYYVIHVLLRIIWIGHTEEGLIIRLSEAAGYRDGDKLIAVAGTPVETFKDIQIVAKTLKAADKITLTVLRDGKETNLDITLGGEGKQPAFEREFKVSIEKKVDLNSSQKAIFSGITGL
jgi:predicted metalloprotease with PDZ domain